MKEFLLQIPTEIIPSWIQPFLIPGEYKRLLDTSKFFQKLKFHTVYLKLRGNYSYHIYQGDENLKQQIFSRVAESKRQISLNLSFFGDIVSLPIELSSIIHSVNLARCNRLVDLTSLASLHTVNISRSLAVSSVNALQRIHSLSAMNCTLITDVSMLGNLVYLNLSDCIGIRDVNALGKVKYLNLSGCINIQDISKLGSVYDLNLSNCKQLIDVSALNQNRKLNLSRCSKIAILCQTMNLYSLNVVECSNIEDFTFLQSSRINHLHISFTSNILQPCFRNIKKIHIVQTYFNIPNDYRALMKDLKNIVPFDD